MHRSKIRLLAGVAALALVAASCGKDRDAADTTAAATTTSSLPATSSSSAAPTTEAAPESSAAGTAPPTVADSTATTESVSDAAMFGDAAWPCGPGENENVDSGSEQGVTADSIRIGTGDDAGYAGSPGLNHEMTDAMEAFVAICNELGGINGRQIELDYYDAKLFEVVPAMQSACDAGTFFLVGQGWAFDANQEETRLRCGLPSVPTFATGAAFAHGQDVYVAVPNPSDEVAAGFYAQLAELFPDEVTGTAALVGAFTATQEARDRAVAGSEQFGFEWVSKTIEYNPVGEADWTPFVKQIEDAGATMIYWSGTCLPSLQLFVHTAAANGVDLPIITDANHYAQVCAEANGDGAMDNVYVRIGAIPFEEAGLNPATQQYMDIVTESGGDISLLGAQTASSFLLWATAADACGTELTRACTLAHLKETTSWTGHGLHAETNPGENHPSPCNVIMKLNGNGYERVVPAEPATFACDPSWVVPVPPTPAVIAAQLDENRISQQFAG